MSLQWTLVGTNLNKTWTPSWDVKLVLLDLATTKTEINVALHTKIVCWETRVELIDSTKLQLKATNGELENNFFWCKLFQLDTEK